jgi:hypothetical protein
MDRVLFLGANEFRTHALSTGDVWQKLLCIRNASTERSQLGKWAQKIKSLTPKGFGRSCHSI